MSLYDIIYYVYLVIFIEALIQINKQMTLHEKFEIVGNELLNPSMHDHVIFVNQLANQLIVAKRNIGITDYYNGNRDKKDQTYHVVTNEAKLNKFLTKNG